MPNASGKKMLIIGIGAACALAVFGVGVYLAFDQQEVAAPFNPVRCMETIPKHVAGLKILQGPRTEESIIRDMVPAACNAEVLFRKIGDKTKNGSVLFKVRVDYSGEVYEAKVLESTIKEEAFLEKVSDIIMHTDHVGWVRDDEDTIYLYPMTFGR